MAIMKMRRLLNFALLSAPVLGQTVIDLSGDGWTLSNASNISVPAKLPSQAHIDLYAADIIPDPYYGLNNFELRWVAFTNWTYTSDPISGLAKNSSTFLVFQGLDTFTSIEFCGKHVASTDNQFRQYYFDVSSILAGCPQDPVLSINFGSAPIIANETAELPGQEVWPTEVNLVYEFTNRWYVRKEQSDFGWDWSAAFSPSGPWQPAYVVQLKPAEVYARNVLIDVYREGQLNNIPPDQNVPWVVNASVDFLGTLPEGASMSYSLTGLDSDDTAESGFLENVTITDGVIQGQVNIADGSVDLWWPVGLGGQTLYNFTIDVQDSQNNSIITVSRRIGFRTIVLNEGVITQEQLSKGIAPGNNWHFEINGHEFFAKGSNLIPPDIFWPNVTEEKMRRLFSDVVRGNQNMLRVWSSGAYQPDFIYDIADEMGILLWSEFEFGDSLYPVDEAFLDNVRQEVDYQTRRVNYHPSLAFWAGGNELENLELALVNSSIPDQYERLKNEYEKLFLETIVPVLFGNTRSISYAPSSTSNGYISLNHTQAPYFIERYENLEEGSIYGETDHYNYTTIAAFDAQYYPVGRFSNEFGYHSMPSLQSWQEVLPPEELHFNSTTVVRRNRHYVPGSIQTTDWTPSLKGMGEMTTAVQQWYPSPSKTDSVANFSAWCHTTQVFQADYYAAQIQFYRQGSSQPARTLGSLYWQLEDIWQAPTWAGIEYDGRWKVLHYTAKDIYSNIIISPIYNYTTHEISAWVISDLWSQAHGYVTATWFDWEGNVLYDLPSLSSEPFAVDPINATRVFHQNLDTILPRNSSTHDLRDITLRLSVNATSSLPNTKTSTVFTHTNWYHASPLSTAHLVDPGLTLTHDSSSHSFTIKATTGVSAWTWLDYPRGALITFSANGFWLAKGESKIVSYEVRTDDTNGTWIDRVTVESLWDNTQS